MREVLIVEEYLDELLALVRPDARAEVVPLDAAYDRVLGTDIATPVSIPVFDNSAMDGYAVRWSDVSAPTSLRVVGEVPAGSGEDPAAGPGECVRIMTGAPLPSFADAVVPVEDTDGGLETVTVRVAPQRGAHVRRAGDDLAAGAVLARAGAVLSPALIGVLAASGITSVDVRPRPRVAVSATGDELVSDGTPLRRGQIYESNSLALAAALTRDGTEVLRGAPVADRAEALVGWLDEASAQADLIVLSGGVSVGAYDVVRDVLAAAGGTFRHVRMQPGKPQGWAVWSGTPVIALPGNPLSASLSYEMFVRPVLDRILGRPARPLVTGVAATGWTSPAGRRQLVPVVVSGGQDGRLYVRPSHARGSASHLVSSLAGADALAVVAEHVTSVCEGDLVTVRWL